MVYFSNSCIAFLGETADCEVDPRSLGPRYLHAMSFLFQKETCFFSKKSHNLGWNVFKIAHNPYFFHTFSTYLICSAVQPSAGHLRSCALEAPKNQVDSTHQRKKILFFWQTHNIRRIRNWCNLYGSYSPFTLTAISWPWITLWWKKHIKLKSPNFKEEIHLEKGPFFIAMFVFFRR